MIPTARPRLYIIAGPNGSGKTTFAMEYLPRWAECREFVNADLIAAGISPFNPTAAAVSAGRAMLRRIADLRSQRADFALETTLASRGLVRTTAEAREAGYVVHLYYLWLPSPEAALQRIAQRVRLGGHDVPAADVRRRYDRGLANLFDHYIEEADTWMLINNATSRPSAVAWSDRTGRTIAKQATWARIVEAARRAPRD